MRKTLCTTLIAAILLAGCAGRRAAPIQIQRLGDERRAVQSIQTEMAQIDQEIKAKKKKQDETLRWNIAMGIIGFVAVVPLFFMNLKDAEGTEIEALKARKTWLQSILEGDAAVEAAEAK